MPLRIFPAPNGLNAILPLFLTFQVRCSPLPKWGPHHCILQKKITSVPKEAKGNSRLKQNRRPEKKKWKV